MIITKEVKKGEFWVHVKEIQYFDEKAGQEVSKGVQELLKLNNNVTIDLEGVSSINSQGFNLLYNIVKLADLKQCKIFFCGIHPDLDELVTTLTYTNEG